MFKHSSLASMAEESVTWVLPLGCNHHSNPPMRAFANFSLRRAANANREFLLEDPLGSVKHDIDPRDPADVAKKRDVVDLVELTVLSKAIGQNCHTSRRIQCLPESISVCARLERGHSP